jgi:hypothetical protein
MFAIPFRTRFDSVLRAQHLDAVATLFCDPSYFDEIPLYSRYEQVEFLKRYGDVDRLLIELALEYLGRVAAQAYSEASTRIIAITVVSNDDNAYLIPSIFLCNGEVNARFKDLHLSLPSAGLGKRVEAHVKAAKSAGAYSILEDRETVPGDVRVFISYKTPPRGLVNLEAFRTGITARQ